MSAKVSIKEFQRGLRQAGEKGRRAAYKAMLRAAEQTLSDAQAMTPIETGDLQSSDQRGRASGVDLKVEIGFNVNYAAAVHENLEAKHPRGGEAKYLEKAIRNMQPKLLEYLASEVRKGL